MQKSFVMKIGIFSDSVLAGSAKVVAASLPFITLGMLSDNVTKIVAGIFGATALVILVVRFCMLLGSAEPRRIASIDNDVDDVVIFPGAFALSSLIAMHAGIDASFGLWFALVVAVLAVVSNHLVRN